MKRSLFVLIALAAILPAASFGLDLVVNPYAQLNAGNVLTTSFPQLGMNYAGVLANTTFDLKEAGKLTPGLDLQLKWKVNNTFSTFTYDFTLDPFATYAISIVTVKLELPFDILRNSGADLFMILLTPAAKLAIDKSSAIAVSLDKTTFYVTTFNIDLTPRVAYSNGPLGVYAQVKFPKVLTGFGQNLTIRPDVSYKIGNFTLEAYADFGSINNGTSPLSLTPAIKVQYSTKVKI